MLCSLIRPGAAARRIPPLLHREVDISTATTLPRELQFGACVWRENGFGWRLFLDNIARARARSREHREADTQPIGASTYELR